MGRLQHMDTREMSKPAYYPTQCLLCENFTHDVENRRTNSAYVDDKQNFIKCCLSCFDRVQDEYAERWRDYYSGCL